MQFFFFFFAFAAACYIPKVAGVSDTKKAFLRMCTADLQISHAGRITLSNLKQMNLFLHLYLYISFLHLQKIIIFSLDNVNCHLKWCTILQCLFEIWYWYIIRSYFVIPQALYQFINVEQNSICSTVSAIIRW